MFRRGYVQKIINISAIVFAVAGFFGTAVAAPAVAEGQARACTLNLLPAEMQRQIKNDYSSWRLQDVTNLSANAKERWQSEKPLDCPGIAVGQFETMNQKSYAVLLVPDSKPDAGYRLLVYTPNENHSPEALRIIDQSDKSGASNFFVHEIQIAKVFSSEWVKKLRVTTSYGILFVGAGTSEYEADVYFWAGDKYRNEAIDY
jgi:hypothetical protein